MRCFIADTVLGLDARRRTPAHRRNDGLDYVPTNKYVLFGHHFAAIAGAGPLVGPVLAAQMGYLPGTLWILAGVVFAGAVQDFIVLFLSTRRDGRSLGDMIRTEMGAVPGVIALVGILLIMIILLAVLALVVVKALADSPWGTFTVFATIPDRDVHGRLCRYIRPGRIGEMSVIGFVLLHAGIAFGAHVSRERRRSRRCSPSRARRWRCMLIGYGFVASVLPVWLLLAPRDYLSTFLKIGTIAVAGDRHHHRPARPADAGGHPVHRRHRPGVRRQPVPVPVHHHRLRRGLGLPRADRPPAPRRR